ncbi:cytochrome P450 [Mycena crocata]|nr:cytochrome P450 [Mycena crocata]
MAPTNVTLALVLILLGCWVIHAVLRRVFSPLDNIPGPPRKSILTGNLTQYHDPDGWEFHGDLEENWGQVAKIHGLLGDKQLYVFDPAALHSILVKDDQLYDQRVEVLSMNTLLFGKGILSTAGADHRKHRKTLMPAFSTANLRELVPVFFEVAERARDNLIAPRVLQGPQTLDFNALFGRISLELIGRTGIGHSFDPMTASEEQTNHYAESLKELFDTAYELSVALPLLPLILKIPSRSFLRSMIPLVPSPTLHKLRDLVDYLDQTAVKIVEAKRAAFEKEEFGAKDSSKDLMSLLMKSNMSVEGDMHLTIDELVATTSMMIFAATDTTSTALNRALFTLATHPEVQDTLRAEILAAPEHPDHDALVALPYLDSVVREILRLYPSVDPSTFRYAKEDTVLPLSTPIIGVDGTPMNAINVPKGTTIYIAIAAANHNKQIWGDDALEFRPERWSNGKAESVTTKMSGVYGNTMTFIGGGRSCIGFKFSQLEMKVVLCVLLRAFKFSQPDPRVKWRMTGLIVAPTIDNHPKLPIRVERVHA